MQLCAFNRFILLLLLALSKAAAAIVVVVSVIVYSYAVALFVFFFFFSLCYASFIYFVLISIFIVSDDYNKYNNKKTAWQEMIDWLQARREKEWERESTAQNDWESKLRRITALFVNSFASASALPDLISTRGSEHGRQNWKFPQRPNKNQNRLLNTTARTTTTTKRSWWQEKKKNCFKPVSNWELLWGSVTFCVGFLFLLVFCFCQFRYHKPNKRCCFFFLRVSGRFSVSTTTTPPTARNGGHKFALPYTQTKTSFKDFYRENIWNFFFGIIFH